MAEIKNGKYKVHNGTDFDTIHFETKASQVIANDGSNLESHLADIATTIASVETFGAIGDWNGETGTDNTSFIQDAFNSNSKRIELNGHYKVTDTLYIPENKIISGYGTIEITSENRDLFVLRGNNISINNVTLRGVNETGSAEITVINLEGHSNIKINNVRINGRSDRSIGGFVRFEDGLEVRSNNVIIEGCEIENFGTTGIELSMAKNTTIKDCKVKTTIREGVMSKCIRVLGAYNTKISGCTLEGVSNRNIGISVQSYTDNGVLRSNADSTLITNNTILNFERGIEIFNACFRTKVTNNTLSNDIRVIKYDGIGIRIYTTDGTANNLIKSEDIKIDNNEFYTMFRQIVIMGCVDDLVISNNMFKGIMDGATTSVRTAFTYTNTTGVASGRITIKNNTIIHRNPDTISGEQSWLIYLGTVLDGEIITIVNNEYSLYNRKADIYFDKSKVIRGFNGKDTNREIGNTKGEIINYGGTSERPTLVYNDRVFYYYDTDLRKPIFWIGNSWVDSTGVVV